MRDTQEHATDPSAVIAEYADMASAREAVEALQFAGVEAAKIRLEGEVARRAAGDTPKNTNKTDGPMTARILGRAMIWGTVGLAAGTLLGVVLYIAGAPGAGSAAAQIAVWAITGVIAGTLIGAYAALTARRDFDLTYTQPAVGSGTVYVAVLDDDQERRARAAKILRERKALRVVGA